VRFYLLVPLFSLLLVALQTAVLNIFSFDLFALEISLIVVIYAGFRLELFRGAFVMIVLGCTMDGVAGVMPGLYVLVYMTVFLMTKLISEAVYSEGPLFVIGYCILCGLFEGAAVILMYDLLFGINVAGEAIRIYLPQSLVMGFIAPVIFFLLDRFKDVVNGPETQKFNGL